VGNDDAFGFGGRAGREDDLGDVVFRDRHRRRVSVAPLDLVQLDDRRVEGSPQRRNVLADQNQLRGDDPCDTRQEVGRGAVVDRHDHDAAQQTRPEGDDPLGPVLAPEDDRVALADAAIVQRRGKAARGARDLGVGKTPAAKAVVVDEKLAAREREISEKVNQRVADHE